MTKDITCVLGLSLGELGPLRSEHDELWEDEDEISGIDSNNILKIMTSFYDKINPEYETLIEKLKNFSTNEVQVPLIIGLLATYRNVKSATLVQVKFSDVQAISTKIFQKNTQIQVDFSFASPIWSQATGGGNQPPLRTQKFVE